MNNKTRLLILKFKNPLGSSEVKDFRGAVIHALGNDNVLFHNHIGERFRYAYPLIQYKCIKGCAAIVCIDEGVEVIGQFFSNYKDTMRIGRRCETMDIDYLRPMIYNVQIWKDEFLFHLNRWLPLNPQNYELFKSIGDENERIAFLEKILIGNILSFTKGIHMHIESELTCRITKIERQYVTRHKNVNLSTFNIVFATNISLPPYIGLGKNSSINCGVVTPFKHGSERLPDKD